MKKETVKELGKLCFDGAKIIFGVAIITPLVQDGGMNMGMLSLTIFCTFLGIYLINKGA